MRDEVLGIFPCWVLTKLKMLVKIVLHRSCHPFRWWPVQPAILSSLLMPFPITISALSAAFTSILSFFSFVSRPSCHSFLFIRPSCHPSSMVSRPSCQPFRWLHIQPTILSSFLPFPHFFVSHLSILSSLFAGEPFILSFLSVPSPLHLVIPFRAAGLSVLSDCLVSIKI